MRKGDRVAFCLFEHNEKAYKSAIRMMEQYDKAAIVRLTTVYQYQIARAKYQARVDDLRAPRYPEEISCGKSGLKQEIHFINKCEFM